jgi:hypothetical protein
MTWFAGVKDLLGIGIALLAVALSLITTIMQRKERQRVAYREIYTVLMSENVHRGRWFINGIRTPDQIPKDGPNRLLIYRTLGVFDNLAMFARHPCGPQKMGLGRMAPSAARYAASCGSHSSTTRGHYAVNWLFGFLGG